MAKKELLCEGCSPLADYYNRAHYCYTRSAKIDTITIHCYVGQVTAQEGCDYFATTTREDGASCNYIVGCDGSIGICVPEPERSACSLNPENDNRAVTIEVASNTDGDFAIRPTAEDALIELVADICKRNGIKRLVWSTKEEDRVKHKNGCNMTVHRDFANTDCPGEWLYKNHGKIADKVNQRLSPVVYIENFNITSITKNAVEAKLTLMEAYDQYTWSYKIVDLLDDTYTSKAISIKKKTPSFKVDGLTGNTPYTLEVLAKNSNGVEVKSPKLVFSTLQNYPDGVSTVVLDNVDFSDLNNVKGTISFKPPSSWGSTDKNLKRGYRLFLAINGNCQKTADNIIKSDYKANSDFPLTTFLKGISFKYEDLMQIGIQPWVEDRSENKILSNSGPSFSIPIYIKPNATPINKICMPQGKNVYDRVSLFQSIK